MIQFADIHELCPNPNAPVEDAAAAEARARECKYKHENDGSDFYASDGEDEDDEGDEDEAEDKDEVNADDESEPMDEDIQADPKQVPPSNKDATSATPAGSAGAGPLKVPSNAEPSKIALGVDPTSKAASDANPTSTPSDAAAA